MIYSNTPNSLAGGCSEVSKIVLFYGLWAYFQIGTEVLNAF
jgi:hypothetical protein